MNGKCAKEKCSLCTCKFQGRRNQHLERWCPTVHSFQYRSGDGLKSKRVDLSYGGLIVNLVGVHDSSWEDWPLVEQVSLLQLTIYYVQSITNRFFIEC